MQRMAWKITSAFCLLAIVAICSKSARAQSSSPQSQSQSAADTLRTIDQLVKQNEAPTKGAGTSSLPGLFDRGFQAQACAVVVAKTFQVYAGAFSIFGQYGKPFDSRIDVNWFRSDNRVVGWNNEMLYLFKSPVGYTAVPFAVGVRDGRGTRTGN